MTKRKPAFNPSQLGFDFEPVQGVTEEGALGALERQTASAISRILKEDPRSRFEIAGGVSALLDDDVSKLMLDAYASEARDGHNISFARFLALVLETQRFDVLDALLAKIGCKVVVGEQILTVELGHLDAQIARLQSRKRVLTKIAPEFSTKPSERPRK